MPKLEFLEKLYPNQESAYLNKVKQYYKFGKTIDLYKNQNRNTKINLEEYNSLRYYYLKKLHSFKEGELAKSDIATLDINPYKFIRLHLKHLRGEELIESVLERETRHKNWKPSNDPNLNSSESPFIDYSKGFLFYKKGNPLFPFIFWIGSMIFGLLIVFLILGLLNLIINGFN